MADRSHPHKQPRRNGREARPADGAETRTGEDEVVDYLKQQTDFLVRHPDLAAELQPPQSYGDGVVSLGQFQNRRLEARAEELAHQLRQAEERQAQWCRQQAGLEKCILALLAARSFPQFVHVLTKESAALLDVEVVTIGVEAVEDWQAGRVNAMGVFVLQPGDIGKIFAKDESVVIRRQRPRDRGLFGAKAPFIEAQALVRLQATAQAPQGLLALGAVTANRFEAAGTLEGLGFLTQVIESQLRAWLELPA